jgi:hypothetical protein
MSGTFRVKATAILGDKEDGQPILMQRTIFPLPVLGIAIRTVSNAFRRMFGLSENADPFAFPAVVGRQSPGSEAEFTEFPAEHAIESAIQHYNGEPGADDLQGAITQEDGKTQLDLWVDRRECNKQGPADPSPQQQLPLKLTPSNGVAPQHQCPPELLPSESEPDDSLPAKQKKEEKQKRKKTKLMLQTAKPKGTKDKDASAPCSLATKYWRRIGLRTMRVLRRARNAERSKAQAEDGTRKAAAEAAQQADAVQAAADDGAGAGGSEAAAVGDGSASAAAVCASGAVALVNGLVVCLKEVAAKEPVYVLFGRGAGISCGIKALINITVKVAFMLARADPSLKGSGRPPLEFLKFYHLCHR